MSDGLCVWYNAGVQLLTATTEVDMGKVFPGLWFLAGIASLVWFVGVIIVLVLAYRYDWSEVWKKAAVGAAILGFIFWGILLLTGLGS